MVARSDLVSNITNIFWYTLIKKILLFTTTTYFSVELNDTLAKITGRTLAIEQSEDVSFHCRNVLVVTNCNVVSKQAYLGKVTDADSCLVALDLQPFVGLCVLELSWYCKSQHKQ